MKLSSLVTVRDTAISPFFTSREAARSWVITEGFLVTFDFRISLAVAKALISPQRSCMTDYKTLTIMHESSSSSEEKVNIAAVKNALRDTLGSSGIY